MTTTTKTQTRGICQVCGRDHAVVRGTMSKHGYKVSEHGWFVGVCSGQKFKPMQIDRSIADATVSAVRADCARLRARAADLQAGRIDPTECSTGRYDHVTRSTIMIPYAEGSTWQQEEARKAAVWTTNRRAEMGESFASQLKQLADKYHGQPLRVVTVDAGPAPIEIGEKREGAGGLALTCVSVRGARVYWTAGSGRKGWTGTQAWRRMPHATAEAAIA